VNPRYLGERFGEVMRTRIELARSALWSAGYHLPLLQRVLSRQRAYSQEGEDLLLLRYFEWRSAGFYVDVGAYHPFRYSNTQLFYERGWRGINIDAMPGSMRAFRLSRPRDVNLEVGVGEVSETAILHVFNEPAFNTFDEATATRHQSDVWRIAGRRQVQVRPLRDLLALHIAPDQKIDFMTIDVEGAEMHVLRSNDWSRFRPEVILAESIGRPLDEVNDDPRAVFLKSVGYRVFGKTFNTFMFVRT
jgi:FkbM family methyltransferase